MKLETLSRYRITFYEYELALALEACKKFGGATTKLLLDDKVQEITGEELRTLRRVLRLSGYPETIDLGTRLDNLIEGEN